MTKRILALLTVLLLTLSVAVAEDAAELTGVHLYGTYFAINYPADWGVSLDDSENTPEDLYCGLLYSPEDTGLNAEVYMYYMADWADHTMLDATNDDLDGYNEMYLAIGETLQYEQINTVYTTKDGIPFLIYDAVDEYGPMYCAETMLNGWFITVYGYAYTDETYEVCRELSADDLALFNAIVASYAPMSLPVPVE